MGYWTSKIDQLLDIARSILFDICELAASFSIKLLRGCFTVSKRIACNRVYKITIG